eukprot:TRINITY_DN5275_c0_g2_i1.p1 TRINITY_DN5275_c0_g2~~TRINITY_DN5275_c0_g2_i1.p1  ORF type:complete len:386 (-),score=83.67 TRINITY_DN5275_c0_g2_i1:90-1247(-)
MKSNMESTSTLNLTDKENPKEEITFEEYCEYQKNYYITKSLRAIQIQEQKDRELAATRSALRRDELLEANSGIALRPDRQISNAELAQLAGTRKYVRLDALNKAVQPEKLSRWFTVAVLCVAGAQKCSKAGRVYKVWSFSSLTKSCAEMADQQVFGGYRIINLILYGRLAETADGNPGDVYAIINPSPMPKDLERGAALKAVDKSQLVLIGKALHFKYCGYLSPINNTPCRNFVNDSIENHCHLHSTAKYGEPKNNCCKGSKSVATKRHEEPEPVRPKVTPMKVSKEEHKKWMANEEKRFSKYIRQRAVSSVRGNQLDKILGDAEISRLDHNFAAKFKEIEVDVSADQDNEFIKKLFEKRKQNHSEKFKSNDLDVKQSVKRMDNK